ncbi:MAG: aspartyl/glutamyl-tRNA amidotransferase subunit C [Euryarchaeota archaeon]|nr:aspartyl/glutamyl-tRNA amidotransferase subunit C [Euryarchaeota archaeon]
MERRTILEVARIARLKLTDEEVEEFSRDLEEVLSYFSTLDEAPSRDEFELDPVRVEDVLREDEPCQEIDPEILRQSMKTYDRYVRGPRLS